MKKKKIIWESVKVDTEKQRILYKTEDHYHHYLNVSFKNLRIVNESEPEHYHIFREILYRNYSEYMI